MLGASDFRLSIWRLWLSGAIRVMSHGCVAVKEFFHVSQKRVLIGDHHMHTIHCHLSVEVPPTEKWRL